MEGWSYKRVNRTQEAARRGGECRVPGAQQEPIDGEERGNTW